MGCGMVRRREKGRKRVDAEIRVFVLGGCWKGEMRCGFCGWILMV